MRFLAVVMWALAAVFGVMALVLLARPAVAQTALCAPLPNMLDGLRTRFSEHVIVDGTAEGARVLVTRADDGSWSIIVVREDVACIVMGGKKSTVDRGL